MKSYKLRVSFMCVHVVLLFLLIFNNQIVIAQTFNEWFKQKKTQKKYLIEQVAAMQIYLDYARKGYGIVKDGTALIADIKNGDFNLSKQFFNSLKEVNPAIRNSGLLKEMRSIVANMLRNQATVLKLINKDEVFSRRETVEVKELYGGLADSAVKDLDELMLLLENGKLELSDDERMARVGKLHQRMKQRYGFQLQTSGKINALAESRMRERKDVQVLKQFHGQ